MPRLASMSEDVPKNHRNCVYGHIPLMHKNRSEDVAEFPLQVYKVLITLMFFSLNTFFKTEHLKTRTTTIE